MLDIKAILFDKDGTVVDFDATFIPATRMVLERICGGETSLMDEAGTAIGFDLQANLISPQSEVVAGTSLDIAKALKPVLGVGDVGAYAVYLDKLYGKFCKKTVTALPGAAETIAFLATSGMRLGIGTNDAEANAALQINALNMKSYFTQILGSDSGHGPKPGPGMVTAFIERCGLAPSEVMMVGDSIHDMEAGRSAGARCVAVETGPASATELDAHAEVVISSIDKLPGLLGLA